MILDVSGLRVRFDGLPEEVAATLAEIWRGYLPTSAGEPACVVAIGDAGRALTPGRVLPADLTIEPSGAGMRFSRDEAVLECAPDGATATLLLARGEPRRVAWGIENLLPALLGWRLAQGGGAALHAAGIVLDGRAFVLVGPAGSGKSTFAHVAAQAGLPVLSDDVVLVDASGDVPVALGAPVRERTFPSPGPGRWPLGALLVGAWGTPPRVERAGRLVAEPRIGANLLYLSRAWGEGGRAHAVLDRLLAATGAYRLTFAPEPSFLDVLRAIPSSPQQ